MAISKPFYFCIIEKRMELCISFNQFSYIVLLWLVSGFSDGKGFYENGNLYAKFSIIRLDVHIGCWGNEDNLQPKADDIE